MLHGLLCYTFVVVLLVESDFLPVFRTIWHLLNVRTYMCVRMGFVKGKGSAAGLHQSLSGFREVYYPQQMTILM